MPHFALIYTSLYHGWVQHFSKGGPYCLWSIECSCDEVHSMKIYNTSSVDYKGFWSGGSQLAPPPPLQPNLPLFMLLSRLYFQSCIIFCHATFFVDLSLNNMYSINQLLSCFYEFWYILPWLYKIHWPLGALQCWRILSIQYS